MKADNLYSHPDGGLYCLVIDDAPMKCPVTGDWLDGLIYIGTDGRMRSTTKARWAERFSPVAEYHGCDEAAMAMIRRTNAEPFDLGDVMTAWHESEVQVTAEMLKLMAATVAISGRFKDENLPETVLDWDNPVSNGALLGVSLTIHPRHLSYVSQNYEIDWEPEDGGYRFSIRK